MLPSDYGPGDIEFWIEPPLLLSIQSDVKKMLDEGVDSQVLTLVRELRRVIEDRGLIKGIGSSTKAFNAYAIDSSYPTPPPLELIGGVMTVLSYGYVGYLNGSYDRYMTGEVVFEDVSEFERVITRRAQVRERELAIKLLRDKARGGRKGGVDLVILDGEIPVHPLPYNLPVEGGVLARVTNVVGDLLELAMKTKTPIIGVVKRVRSRFLSVLTNECLPMNDKLIASLVLSNGEYMVLGNYGDILPPQWLRINYGDCELRKRCKSGKCDDIRDLMSRRLSEGLVNLERVFSGSTHPGLKMLRDIYVVFYKPRNGAPAVKLEVFNPSDGGEY